MKEKFNLSEKRENVMKTLGWSYPEKNVKEFIKRLKEKLEQYRFCTFIGAKEKNRLIEFINELAGSKLK